MIALEGRQKGILILAVTYKIINLNIYNYRIL